MHFFFRTSKDRGRPTAWTGAELFQLIIDVDEAKGQLRRAGVEVPKLPDACRRLVRQKVYRQDWKTLRKRYYRALMPEHNSLLKEVLDKLLAATDGSPPRKRGELPLMFTRAGAWEAYKNKAGNIRFRPRRLRLATK